MVNELIQKAGLYANLAGIFTVLSFVALFIFFGGVRIFGPINDGLSVFQFLFLVPVALALHAVLGAQNPGVSLSAAVVGIAAMLVFAVLQAALTMSLVSFEQTLRAILITGGVVGLWFLVVGILTLQSQVFPAGLAWVGILCGSGYVLGLFGFWVGGWQHPLALVSFGVGAIAVPIWCFWLGRLLTSGRLPLPA